MSKLDLRKEYLKLAHDQLNPKSNDIQALEQILVNWFCLKFDTTPNDPRLLGMRLDELLLFRMMHEIKDRPSVMDEINAQDGDYEDWLKKQMGDDYKSVDQMILSQEEIEKEEKEIAEQMPDKIETDFASARGE